MIYISFRPNPITKWMTMSNPSQLSTRRKNLCRMPTTMPMMNSSEMMASMT